jgi:endonuclease/exonuclease/phosphatase family metal-dependent hydrolase
MTRRNVPFEILLVVHLALTSGCATDANREPYVRTTFIDGPDHRPTGPTLTVATFNVHGLADAEGLRRDFASLANVDVWLLQELFVPTADDGSLDATRDVLAHVLPPGRWNVVVARLNRFEGPRDGYESQAIASRLPLRDPDLWPLPARGPKRRAAILATVDAPGGAVRVVDTDHEVSFLDVGYGNRLQVTALVDRLRAGAVPTVVGGDFNTGGNFWRLASSAKNVDDVDRAMSDAGYVAPVGRDAESPTFHHPAGDVRIDHLYARGLTIRAWGSPTSVGSDHRAVWIRAVPSPRP